MVEKYKLLYGMEKIGIEFSPSQNYRPWFWKETRKRFRMGKRSKETAQQIICGIYDL